MAACGIYNANGFVLFVLSSLNMFLFYIFIFLIAVPCLSVLPQNNMSIEILEQPRINFNYRSEFSLLVLSSTNLTTSIRLQTSKNTLIKSTNPTTRDIIFVIALNSEQLPIFSYWLRWARVAGLSKFLVVAMDEKSAAHALSLNLRTFSLTFLHSSYRDKIYFLHKFLVSLLLEGISFISMKPNIFMFDMSSFSLLDKDIYLLVRGSPTVNNANERVRLHTDLFGISSSATRRGIKGLDFMRRVGHCFINGTASKKEDMILRSSVTQHYQSCMEKSLLWEMRHNGNYWNVQNMSSVSFLDNDLVVNSKQLFKWKLPQSRGVVPPMLLIDEPVETAALVNLLKDWNLNLKEGENNNNNPNVEHAPYVSHSSSIIAARSPSNNNIALTIRIITMDRPTSLKRLLASLSNAHYDNDTVHIEFYVDKTNSTSTVDQTQNRAVVEIVKAFRWTHGSVQRNFEKQNAGIFKMWVRPFPVDDSRNDDTTTTTTTTTKPFLMVLEDDIEVSPFFYSWAKKVLLTYSPHGDDGNLYGFTIQRSQGIIGTKKGENWVESYHDRNVSRSAPFFRYQLLSTWGQIFFPRHWNAFVKWALVARNQVGFKPCVPYLVSNYWYQANPEKIWSIWFNYFVYHSGLTNLYINFNHFSPVTNYALLVNYRENGLHYFSGSNNATTTDIIKRIVPAKFINSSMEIIELPPMSQIPLYNFFFNLVKNEELLKHQWRFTSNCADQCITNVL